MKGYISTETNNLKRHTKVISAPGSFLAAAARRDGGWELGGHHHKTQAPTGKQRPVLKNTFFKAPGKGEI